ncbi:MAG TPA: PEP-CTERM sorting domain-containing protein [Verrucomicrobiae bacterium]|nr:PEP-CTERM sorting domain-containing protein [Verrucomicrobiae bacterium]
MKRALFLSTILALACLARSQGTVNFNNHSTAVSAPVYDVNIPVSGPDVVAGLFYNGVQQGASAPFRTGNGAGFWNAGADTTRVIDGVPGGQPATLDVRVWDSSKGATYDAAVAAGSLSGKSDPFTIILGGGGTPPSVPADMIGFRSIAILPEPSTIALFALGGAGLAAVRRRK